MRKRLGTRKRRYLGKTYKKGGFSWNNILFFGKKSKVYPEVVQEQPEVVQEQVNTKPPRTPVTRVGPTEYYGLQQQINNKLPVEKNYNRLRNDYNNRPRNDSTYFEYSKPEKSINKYYYTTSEQGYNEQVRKRRDAERMITNTKLKITKKKK